MSQREASRLASRVCAPNRHLVALFGVGVLTRVEALCAPYLKRIDNIERTRPISQRSLSVSFLESTVVRSLPRSLAFWGLWSAEVAGYTRFEIRCDCCRSNSEA